MLRRMLVRAGLREDLKNVGQDGHDNVKALLHSLWTAGEIDNQSLPMNADDLSRCHRHRRLGKSLHTHLFSHAGHETIHYIECRLRSHIPRPNTRSARGHNECIVAAIRPGAELSGDNGSIIRRDDFFGYDPARCGHQVFD